MAEIQIKLPDSIREYAAAQVASGRFSSIQDYLGALVSADERTQQIMARFDEVPHLAALLEAGLESAPGRRWSPAVLQEFKQELLNHSAGNRP